MLKRVRSVFDRNRSKGASDKTTTEKTTPASTATPTTTTPAPVAAAAPAPAPAAAAAVAAAPAADAQQQPITNTQNEPAQFEINAVAQQAVQAAATGTLRIALRNDSASSNVFAYITGRAIDNGNALVLMQADGQTPYFPTSPSGTQTPLQQNIAIRLGAPGQTVVATVPRIAGGRIWFSIDGQLTFLLNPGPALVEPSVTNPSDPSINVNWTFAEFTFNADQLYANISYVDFISIPISLSLIRSNGPRQHVSGTAENGLSQIADGLRAQQAQDGQGWDRLIVPTPGNPSQPLRILSPNQARVGNPSLLANYFDGYVNDVYTRLTTQSISVDTQASFGVVTGQVPQETVNAGNPMLYLGGTGYAKPTSSDIWTCDTGPFATGLNAERNAIIPRLSAAFNRTTLLTSTFEPASADLYYKSAITNHYARVVHAANLDGKGYAFPYDDVQPTGGLDASGKVQAGDPQLFTIAIGGQRANTIDS